MRRREFQNENAIPRSYLLNVNYLSRSHLRGMEIICSLVRAFLADFPRKRRWRARFPARLSPAPFHSGRERDARYAREDGILIDLSIPASRNGVGYRENWSGVRSFFS